jgi:16S rRNA (guanine1207-N2)-methyltransferase
VLRAVSERFASARSSGILKRMSRFHHQSDAALETLLSVLREEPELLPAQGRIAFIHARAHQGLARLQDRLVCVQDFKPVADNLEVAGLENHETFEGKFALVIVLPERQKDETLADFAQAFELLEDNGVILVGLHNDWGAKRFEKLLDQAAGKLGTISKHHSRAFWARKTSALNQDLLDEWKARGGWQKVIDGRFWSRPGLFSWEKIDGGSRYLTEHQPEGIQGRVADLGGGWGFLSDFVLRRYPDVETLDVFEADRVALEACRRNLTETGSKARVHYHWADVTDGVGEKKFDFIVVNPPFHEDRLPDPLLGIKFIAAASRALKPGGELWLVANRHLAYEAFMNEYFQGQFSIVAQDGSYKVLRGIRGSAEVAEESDKLEQDTGGAGKHPLPHRLRNSKTPRTSS